MYWNKMLSALYIGFIDFKEAFDSVRKKSSRTFLGINKYLSILRNYGIPDNYVNIIQEIYDRSTYCIVENGRTSDWFHVERGVD